MGDGRRTAVAR
ncbi:unnamed protein product [Cuscuta europaea]|uniref:Uncharacterized protein n=1 Tax=Cuscuta europaea TaxID=41803 RepID=A0A9P0Z7D6_CUSEU|nr:unnamed protein product [Cuscuta europaea]